MLPERAEYKSFIFVSKCPHPLLLLDLVRELGPRVRLATQGHVAGEGTLLLLHHADLQEPDEGNDLEKPEGRDLRQCCQSVGHIRERDVGRGRQHPREPEVLLDEVPRNGEHGDTSVLDLNVPQAVEPAPKVRETHYVTSRFRYMTLFNVCTSTSSSFLYMYCICILHVQFSTEGRLVTEHRYKYCTSKYFEVYIFLYMGTLLLSADPTDENDCLAYTFLGD